MNEPDYKALYEITFKELQKALEEVQSLKARPQAIKAAPKLSPEDELFQRIADGALREMAITKEKRIERMQAEHEVTLQRKMDALTMKMIYESGLPPSALDSVIKISTT